MQPANVNVGTCVATQASVVPRSARAASLLDVGSFSRPNWIALASGIARPSANTASNPLSPRAAFMLELANRLSVRWAIDDLMGVAIGQMRGARAALAKPATLPRSFQN